MIQGCPFATRHTIHTAVGGRLPLPVELHAATRSEHASLNRTIIARLPLCLPNATSTPDLYTQGISVFAQIYYGFEEAWDILLSEHKLNHKQRGILSLLDIPELRRSGILRSSLQRLSETSTHISAVRLTELQTATFHFREEIKQSILDKPHLILAYTWTMYLALFNGGRWIAKQLLSAGTFFWGEDDRAAIVRGSLAFWFFGDNEDYDGEDIKIAFKNKFNIAADALTDEERDEVIAESQKLFRICADMVEYLDEYTQSDVNKQTTTSSVFSKIPITRSTTTTGVLDYLSTFTQAPVATVWRSLINRLPTVQAVIPVSFHPEVEQAHA